MLPYTSFGHSIGIVSGFSEHHPLGIHCKEGATYFLSVPRASQVTLKQSTSQDETSKILFFDEFLAIMPSSTLLLFCDNLRQSSRQIMSGLCGLLHLRGSTIHPCVAFLGLVLEMWNIVVPIHYSESTTSRCIIPRIVRCAARRDCQCLFSSASPRRRSVSRSRECSSIWDVQF